MLSPSHLKMFFKVLILLSNTNDSEFSGDLKPTTPVRNQKTTPKPYHNGVATTSHGSSSLVASSGLVKPKPHPSSRIR